jgi:hypothetical protein
MPSASNGDGQTYTKGVDRSLPLSPRQMRPRANARRQRNYLVFPPGFIDIPSVISSVA